MAGLTGGIFSAIGGAVNNIYGRWSNERDFGYQKDLNNNQIAWRVADAQRAGIHPLYALGPTGATFSPVSTNFTQDAGQDLTRAMQANMDRRERERDTGARLAVTRAEERRAEERHKLDMATGLENLRSQVARNNSAQLGPGGPVLSRDVERVPSLVTADVAADPSRQAGTITDRQFVRTSRGWVAVPSVDVNERIQDNLPEQFRWQLRNNMIGPFTDSPRPPSNAEVPLRRGYYWHRDYFSGEWTQRREGRRSRRNTGGGW